MRLIRNSRHVGDTVHDAHPIPKTQGGGGYSRSVTRSNTRPKPATDASAIGLRV